jgi:hypothetical protein
MIYLRVFFVSVRGSVAIVYVFHIVAMRNPAEEGNVLSEVLALVDVSRHVWSARR